MASNQYAGADAGVMLGAIKKKQQNPYAGADSGMFTGAFKGPTPQVNKIGAWSGATPAASPYAGADAGGLDQSNSYQANSPLAKLNRTVNSTAAPAAAPAAPAAAPAAPAMNPIDALYQKIRESYGEQRSGREQFYDDQMKNLADRVASQTGIVDDRIAQARAAISAARNPYQGLPTATSTTTGNPIAGYMEAAGIDPSQVQAMVEMNAANNQQYDNALANTYGVLNANFQQGQDSRMSDLDLINAGFASDLAGQQNAVSAALEMQKADEMRGFADRLLDMDRTQVSDRLAYDNNREGQSMSLFQNVLNSYGDSLDSDSLVRLVTKFSETLGVPATQMLAGVTV